MASPFDVVAARAAFLALKGEQIYMDNAGRRTTPIYS
jgi:hypothetical protein